MLFHLSLYWPLYGRHNILGRFLTTPYKSTQNTAHSGGILCCLMTCRDMIMKTARKTVMPP